MRRSTPGGEPKPTLGDVESRVEGILRLAQRQADEHVAEARREAEEIVAAARRQADEILAAARREAHHITDGA